MRGMEINKVSRGCAKCLKRIKEVGVPPVGCAPLHLRQHGPAEGTGKWKVLNFSDSQQTRPLC